VVNRIDHATLNQDITHMHGTRAQYKALPQPLGTARSRSGVATHKERHKSSHEAAAVLKSEQAPQRRGWGALRAPLSGASHGARRNEHTLRECSRVLNCDVG